jgi:hypothetical protein
VGAVPGGYLKQIVEQFLNTVAAPAAAASNGQAPAAA